MRAALLVDLALAGRLADDDGGIEIDTETTGFATLDRFVAALAGDPARTLADWLGKGPPVQMALVKQLIAEGRLIRRPGHGALAPVKRYVEPASHPGTYVDDVRESCIQALAGLAGTSTKDFLRPTEETLAACGPARWLIAAADSFITHSRERLAWAESLVQSTEG